MVRPWHVDSGFLCLTLEGVNEEVLGVLSAIGVESLPAFVTVHIPIAILGILRVGRLRTGGTLSAGTLVPLAVTSTDGIPSSHAVVAQGVGMLTEVRLAHY